MAKKLDIDITQHELVPRHSLLDEEEKKGFLADNDVKFVDMPKIFVNDPAVKPLGAQSGDIIKIERVSPTAGYSVFFRGVVDEQ